MPQISDYIVDISWYKQVSVIYSDLINLWNWFYLKCDIVKEIATTLLCWEGVALYNILKSGLDCIAQFHVVVCNILSSQTIKCSNFTVSFTIISATTCRIPAEDQTKITTTHHVTHKCLRTIQSTSYQIQIKKFKTYMPHVWRQQIQTQMVTLSEHSASDSSKYNTIWITTTINNGSKYKFSGFILTL